MPGDGRPDWAKDEKFTTVLARKQNEEQLDKLIEQWTRQHRAEEVMMLLQAAGVPAGVVETAEDIHNDPRLEYRKHFWTLEHPEMGPFPCDAPSFRLSETPAEPRMPAPCLGEHNEYFYKQVLGMPEEEYIDLLLDHTFE